MRQEIMRIVLFLLCFEHALKVVAFPRLFRRQDGCDQVFCLYWSEIVTPAQQTIDTISGYLEGLFLQDQIDPQTPTIPTEEHLPGIGTDSNEQNSDLKSPTDTQINPQIPPFAGSEQCTQYAPPVGAPELSNHEDESQNFRPCGVTTAYIIVPTDCGSPENTQVEKLLLGMDPKFTTSRSPWCKVENGVMFWLANLSPEQAMDLEGQTEGAVKTIMPDVQSQTEPLTPAPELMTVGQIPAAAGTDGRLRMRDQLEVQVRRYQSREVADPSLTFLSNAPDAPKEDLKDYAYFRSAVEASQAQEVRVYVIGSGFDRTNPDISHDRLSYMYGLGCRTRPNDDGKEGYDSCVVSKIGGEKFGVFPNDPAFTIVKIGPSLSALFDSLGKVIRNILSKPHLSGRAVVHISGHWPAKEIDRDAITLMQQGIQALLNLKVMIVTHAGSFTEGEQMILNMPADLAKTMNFITAGSVVPFITPMNPFVVWAKDSRNIDRPCRHSKRARLWVLLRQGEKPTAVYRVRPCRCRYDWTGRVLSRYPGSAPVFYGTAEFRIRSEAICDCDVVSEEWALDFGLERARRSRNSHCLQSAWWRAMDWDTLCRESTLSIRVVFKPFQVVMMFFLCRAKGSWNGRGVDDDEK